MLDERLATFLPSWLVRLDTPASSRDPLGLQAHGMEHADRLLPGLNVFTSRARYYTFLCWAIAAAQDGAPPAEHLARMHRLERLLVLTEALRHADDSDVCSYVGRRRGKRFVIERAGAALWELPTKVLKNQTTNGALRLYRTSLADLGLIEEDDLEEGLGLRLTQAGAQLARQYDKADGAIVSWALGGTEKKKRRDALLDASKVLCLSGRIGAFERRHLLARFFGGEPNALVRRETTQIVLSHGFLREGAGGADLAAADADLVSDDGGKPADEAAAAETRGNWAVLRGVLNLSTSSSLRALQAAAAYQVLALGLNGLFASALRPTTEYGRMSLAAWRTGVAERAGSAFASKPALAWAGRRRIVSIVEDLLNDDRPWHELGALSMELLLRVTLDPRVSKWLSDDVTPMIDRALHWARDAEQTSAAELATRLLGDLIAHHAEVSARKGKGEWLSIDGGDVVRVDARPMRLGFHALRFAQLEQLVADLRLTQEDVADAT